MIIGNALESRLRCRQDEAEAAAQMEERRRCLRMVPGIAALEAGLPDAARRGSQAVLDLAARFLDDAAISAAMETMAGAALADPFARPPLRTAFSQLRAGLVMIDDPSLTILLAVMTADALSAKRAARIGSASIVFSGQRCWYRFLRAGGARLSFWEVPQIGPDFSGAGSDALCRLVERRTLADGESFALDGRHQAFVIDSAEAPMVYLEALTPLDAAPVMAEYDSATLAFVGASSTDEEGSRIGMMLSLLRQMDRADAAPLFVDLLHSTPHFNLRWHIMRELLALDAEAALPHLRVMADADPHPEVRAAAAATLEAFFPEPQADEEEAELCHA
jgi:hypothetical protein